MRKTVLLSLSGIMLLCSCGTTTGDGAYMGAMLGSVLGSAVGGIAGGPRGSDIGTVVGGTAGVLIGAAAGAQAEAQQQREYDEYKAQRRAARYGNIGTQGGYNDDAYGNGAYTYSNSSSESYSGGSQDDSGFDPTNSGDDTLYDFNGSDYTGNYSAAHPETVHPSVRYDIADGTHGSHFGGAAHSSTPLEVRNARFVDDNEDHRLSAGELAKVIFEVYNTSPTTVYDVQPIVVEASGSKHIMISQGVHVEKIAPGKGIRYTAMVQAGRKLKNGNACFRVYAAQGNDGAVSNVSEFNIPTSKK